MWPPLADGLLAGVAPIVLGLLAVVMRLSEHAILPDEAGRDLTRWGRALVECLSVGGQVAIVAAGVCLAMLWGTR